MSIAEAGGIATERRAIAAQGKSLACGMLSW